MRLIPFAIPSFRASSRVAEQLRRPEVWHRKCAVPGNMKLALLLWSLQEEARERNPEGNWVLSLGAKHPKGPCNPCNPRVTKP